MEKKEKLEKKYLNLLGSKKETGSTTGDTAKETGKLFRIKIKTKNYQKFLETHFWTEKWFIIEKKIKTNVWEKIYSSPPEEIWDSEKAKNRKFCGQAPQSFDMAYNDIRNPRILFEDNKKVIFGVLTADDRPRIYKYDDGTLKKLY